MNVYRLALSSVYSNDGSLQQLLVSQNILLLNSEEELTKIQKKVDYIILNSKLKFIIDITKGVQEKQPTESEGGIIQGK